MSNFYINNIKIIQDNQCKSPINSINIIKSKLEKILELTDIDKKLNELNNLKAHIISLNSEINQHLNQEIIELGKIFDILSVDQSKNKKIMKKNLRKKRKYRKRKNAEKSKDEEIKIEIEIKNENDTNHDKLDDGIKEIVCEIEPNIPKNKNIKMFDKQQNYNNTKHSTITNNNIISIKIGEENEL